MKRIIIYLLMTAVLAVSLCGCSAIEETQEKKSGTEGLNFILSGDKESYYCAGFGLVPDGPAYVVVPAEYNGKPVTGIAAKAFLDEQIIQEVVLPDTITFIGERAFYYMGTITAITLPDSVVEIRAEAFTHCANLECLYIYTDGWVDYRGNAVDFSDPKAAAELLKRGGSYTRVTEDDQ